MLSGCKNTLYGQNFILMKSYNYSYMMLELLESPFGYIHVPCNHFAAFLNFCKNFGLPVGFFYSLPNLVTISLHENN